MFADDERAGINAIRPILGGCVLQESWRGDGGSAGSSFNFYNPNTEKWQQFWVWQNGTTLVLTGAFRDGRMILTGESISRTGDKVLNRITWYDNDDDTVRQHWEQSTDLGKSWATAFDGHYRKKE